MTESLWHVALPSPLRRTFLYRVPAEIGIPAPGKRVRVSFGHRHITGVLMAPAPETEAASFTIKNVLAILDETPIFPLELLSFVQQAAAYYLYPIGEALKAALPAALERDDDLESVEETTSPTYTAIRRVTPPSPEALTDILAALERSAPKRAALWHAIPNDGEIPETKLCAGIPRASTLLTRLIADGLAERVVRVGLSDPYLGAPVARDVPPTLTDEQAVAVLALDEQLHRLQYGGFLLHGVTGSGKTEVYFHAIATARALGRGALVLVPEISLTPQLVHRYRARFGDELAVLHSALTNKNRLDQWRLLRSGQVKVVIGVRSAVFAPLENLGVIIVDEEHDTSFKQESHFTYSARDLALLRASRTNAVAILGSATPAIETYYNATSGKLQRLTLTTRATSQPLPEVTVIDTRQYGAGPGNQRLILEPLHVAIQETLKRGEQTILFLNRRGFAPSLLCGGCGEVIECKHCSVSLTYHRHPEGLVCHYCGTKRGLPNVCPKCGSTNLFPIGVGTQKVEETLQDLYPEARIARMDRDSASGRKGEDILAKLRSRHIDILVGTQMVTKGHDFPFVTLVGVLNADVGLHMPDFRATERTFQLLSQVAGRAGRAERGGRAIVQTHSPNHLAIDLARTHNYLAFAAQEIAIRKELNYPPFGRLAALHFGGPGKDAVAAAAKKCADLLHRIQGAAGRPPIDILGPAEAPLAKVQNLHRYRLLLRATRQDAIRGLLEPAIAFIEKPPKGVRIRIDIDPQSML